MTPRAESTSSGSHRISTWREHPKGERFRYAAKCSRTCGWSAKEPSIGAITGAIAVHLIDVWGHA